MSAAVTNLERVKAPPLPINERPEMEESDATGGAIGALFGGSDSA